MFAPRQVHDGGRFTNRPYTGVVCVGAHRDAPAVFAPRQVHDGGRFTNHIARSATLGIDLRGQVQESPSSKPDGFRLQDFACTTLLSGRRLDITAHHDVLQARRAEQATPAFRTEMHQRAGIESTFSEGVRAHDLRHCRYRGLLKTQFQCSVTAAAMNLKRFLSRAAA